MGGPGSGRWCRWDRRALVEDYLALDVRQMHHQGFLRPGRPRLWSWRYEDGHTPSISYQVCASQGSEVTGVILDYRTGSGEDMRYQVAVEWTPCNYGGQRPWFLCPDCGRRVAILYGGLRFLCRGCSGLRYLSQRGGPADRLLLKTQRIRERLGGSASTAEPFPGKPKGMHCRTYERLRRQATTAELAVWRSFLDR